MELIIGFLHIAIAITLLTTSQAAEPSQIRLLRPRFGSGGRRVEGLDCLSWRLAVETNNLRSWKVVPQSCEDYVGNYMLGRQYRRDIEVVAEAAVEYAKSVQVAGDGKDLWVFDIDETSLSNLPYYARSDVQFGSQRRILNLNQAGYYNWEKLILKGENDHGSSVDYKSQRRTELVNEGYRIVGNIGDQWSDLIGTNVGNRTFKVPDPMYYIG
ncbi:acid phosphatase 1-like [Salvia hispanica]|uniref:acid phosphatase 1-like n=1 Tax=Salvia hispanica TaxID=49212 RepID=UPI00200996BF|nr:acid phosphatase 1-like [Salvia hispanica]